MTFAEKLKEARNAASLSQTQLAEKIGVSKRSIIAYETGASKPREKVLYQIAMILNASIKYLTNQTCDNPTEDIEKDFAVAMARDLYGHKGAIEMNTVLSQNKALLAGGTLSEDEMDSFYQAVTETYFLAKQKAKAKFGKKK